MRNSKSPSIHSIYQNALPFYHDRADLTNIDTQGVDFARNFLTDLLNGTVSVQMDADNISADKLRHIYFESKNFERTAGPKTFGLGFPLFIDSFEGELLVAPMFVWQMHLEPAQAKVDSWIIRFSDDDPIMVNHQVVQHLRKKFDLDWAQRMGECVESNALNADVLQEVCHELRDRLQLEEKGEVKSITSTPGIDTIGNLTEKGTLHWSGVLGLYPPQNLLEKPEELKPEDVFVSTELSLSEDEVVFPFTPCDPEQMTAIEMVSSQSMSIVEGVDDLGKTQTVLNLLINSLLNGKKCLVISERIQSLKKVQDLLAKSGINQFHFLLDDALNDKLPLLELMRVMAGGVEYQGGHNEKNFQEKKSKYASTSVQLRNSYRAVKNKIFGQFNWSDVVGLYLKSQMVEGRDLLAGDLNASDFLFNEKEHSDLKANIKVCRPSFEQIGTLNHPLKVLHHRFFAGDSSSEALDKVQSLLANYLQKAKELQHRFINTTDAYAAGLRAYYGSQHATIESLLTALENKIKTHEKELGEAFRNAGSGGLNLGLFFSSKKKKVAKAQKDVANAYQSVLDLYNENRLFEYEPLPDKNGMHVEKVIHNSKSFRDTLTRWHNRVEGIVHDETNRLNSKTAHVALDVKEKITELEYSLELFIEELNESGLFQKPFENKTMTIPQRQKYLETILEQLESSQLNLRDFPVFHQWQTNWLGLSPLGSKVVKSLIKVKPNNWVAAFESWYYHKILLGTEKGSLPKSFEVIEDYAKSWHDLKPLVINKIQQNWKERQANGLKTFRRKNKSKFQSLFGKSKRENKGKESLSEVFSDSFDIVTDFLPVLFVSPHVALNVLPKDFKFDLIIFEESNRFSVEMATTIVGKGERVAIFGSDDNNGKETSLLQYALESGVPSAKITNIYEAPTVNHLATSSSSHVFHFAHDYFIDNLEGRFHEMEGTNDVEAQHIIRLLNQVKQTPQRVYPTVGIVAFTVEQRDLISSYLLKLKQQNAVGSEKIRQLERNGLGVYFSEEVFGQQFDIMILSCTFGVVNLKGELTKKLMFLNTPEGLSHLHLLINKPVQQLFLVHSLSDATLENLKGKKYEEGTWLLANFIQLAEATRNGNEQLVEESLEAIGKKEQRKLGAPPFDIQVCEALTPYIDKSRISLAEARSDILIPLTIKPVYEGQSKTILTTDIFMADTGHTSGIWEYQRLQGLRKNAFNVLPVSSINWFEDYEGAVRRLASQLIKLDGEHVPKAETNFKIGEENDEKSNEPIG